MICYALLKLGQTITSDLHRTQLIHLKQALSEKWPEYARSHIKKTIKTTYKIIAGTFSPPALQSTLCSNDYNFFYVTIHNKVYY